VFNGSQLSPGRSENKVTVRILDEMGVDVTEEYRIEYLSGTLSVYSTQLHIAAGSLSKVYDSTPLTPTEKDWKLMSGSPMLEHEIRVTMLASQTRVGSCDSPITAVITDKDMAKNPCMLCSRLRRGHLYRLAAELNCGKLALGQHLDDIISSFLMSLCRGQGLTSMAPKVVPDDPAHPVVIRPLALVPEELIRSCADAFDFPVSSGKCQYEKLLKSGDRAQFSELVEELSRRIPGLRSNIARSLSKVEIDHLLIPPDEA
jgi:hypothetical protein